MGGTYKIGKVEYTRKKTGAAGIWKEIKIEVKNGETGSWQTAYNGTIAETADGASTDITFEPVDASDVKVTVVKVMIIQKENMLLPEKSMFTLQQKK